MRAHHGIWPGANKQCLPAWDPRIQASQVKFIKQFTMSLPIGQSRGMGFLGTHQPPPVIALPQGVWGTGNAATTLATGVFFQRVCVYAVLFLTTMTTFLLPCLNLVYVFCPVRPCSKEPSSVHKVFHHDVNTFSCVGPSCLHWYYAY